MAGNEGAFAKIAGATATGGGNNIRDGIYKFLVEKVTLNSGHSGTSFIAEFRVMEAQENGATDERGNPIKPNTVGSTCSMVCNLTKHESAAGNAKAFMVNALAGLGITEDKITQEVMGQMCDESNPMRGLAVTDETYRSINKGRSNPANAGKSLTLNKWKPIAQTKEDVAAQKAYLDSNAARADVTPTPAATFPAATTAAQTTQTVAVETPAALPVAQAVKPAGGGLLGNLLGLK